MAFINHIITYKVTSPYALSIRLVGKPNKPWAAYPSGYNLMTGPPNFPPSSAHTPPAFGTDYNWTYAVRPEFAHDIQNIIVETTCKIQGVNVQQLGDIYYAYTATPNEVSWSLGTEPISGDPALIFTWDSLCDTCVNVKEYIITYVEAGSGNVPFSVTIPMATVLANPNFPTYTEYITNGVNPLLTYDVTFQVVLTYEYDVDTSVDPSGHITIEQYVNGNLNP